MTTPDNHLPDPQLDSQFYAGVPFKRLLAWLVDLTAVVAISFALIIASLGLLALFAVPVSFLVNFTYRFLTINNRSATWGMRLIGIELRNKEGNHLSTSEAAFHTALFVVLFMSVLGIFASMLAMLVTDRGRGIHDLILGTTAINRPAD